MSYKKQPSNSRNQPGQDTQQSGYHNVEKEGNQGIEFYNYQQQVDLTSSIQEDALVLQDKFFKLKTNQQQLQGNGGNKVGHLDQQQHSKKVVQHGNYLEDVDDLNYTPNILQKQSDATQGTEVEMKQTVQKKKVFPSRGLNHQFQTKNKKQTVYPLEARKTPPLKNLDSISSQTEEETNEEMDKSAENLVQRGRKKFKKSTSHYEKKYFQKHKLPDFMLPDQKHIKDKQDKKRIEDTNMELNIQYDLNTEYRRVQNLEQQKNQACHYGR